MPSAFVDHLLQPLAVSRPHTPTGNESKPLQVYEFTDRKQELHAVLANLSRASFSESLVEHAIQSLGQADLHSQGPQALSKDLEVSELERAITEKLLVGLYSKGLETCLSQASTTESDVEWWAEIQRTRLDIMWYTLQTLPNRLARLATVITNTIREQGREVNLESFRALSFHQLMASPHRGRPNALLVACYPHLRHQSYSVTSSTIFANKEAEHGDDPSHIQKAFNILLTWAELPLTLTRQECTNKRRELEKIRNSKAEILGHLTALRGDLQVALKDPSKVQWFAQKLVRTLGEDPDDFEEVSKRTYTIFPPLVQLSTIVFQTQHVSHTRNIRLRELERPSRLTLLWPKLVFLPPILLYGVKYAYSSRVALSQVLSDAKATAQGFLKGWVMEPLKDVIKTVRAGGEGGVIVMKEGVEADIESLERMALSLAKDQLRYGPEQLAELSKQIRLGNLTAILQIYEEDIKRPVKSAIVGTLLRSLFIQIQKAKVDIDQALTGIDKLLKSQELTFAFVGVAPALGLLYFSSGMLLNLLRGGSRKGRYGGKRRIAGTLSTMRRIERLLVFQPGQDHGSSNSQLSPLTSGLLVLSVARLRTFAETCLPAQSKLREGFLEDVGDLENPDLNRDEKMKAVERMWRCWGRILGWGRVMDNI